MRLFRDIFLGLMVSDEKANCSRKQAWRVDRTNVHEKTFAIKTDYFNMEEIYRKTWPAGASSQLTCPTLTRLSLVWATSALSQCAFTLHICVYTKRLCLHPSDTNWNINIKFFWQFLCHKKINYNTIYTVSTILVLVGLCMWQHIEVTGNLQS